MVDRGQAIIRTSYVEELVHLYSNTFELSNVLEYSEDTQLTKNYRSTFACKNECYQTPNIIVPYSMCKYEKQINKPLFKTNRLSVGSVVGQSVVSQNKPALLKPRIECCLALAYTTLSNHSVQYRSVRSCHSITITHLT